MRTWPSPMLRSLQKASRERIPQGEERVYWRRNKSPRLSRKREKDSCPSSEEETDEREQAPAVEPEVKDPSFTHLPKSPFMLDEFMHNYANGDTHFCGAHICGSTLIRMTGPCGMLSTTSFKSLPRPS